MRQNCPQLRTKDGTGRVQAQDSQSGKSCDRQTERDQIGTKISGGQVFNVAETGVSTGHKTPSKFVAEGRIKASVD